MDVPDGATRRDRPFPPSVPPSHSTQPRNRKGPMSRRRYSSSKLRILFLTLLLGAVALMAASGYAQGTDAGAAAAKPAGENFGIGDLMRLILANKDPVLFVILGLSIAGVTFIIQGF